ncbi:MAG: hypothetical protein ACKO3N_19465 [Verrucomicrobiota bacterium]
MRIEKLGRVSVPIDSTKAGISDTFVVVWYGGSPQVGKSFANLRKAPEFAEKQARALTQPGPGPSPGAAAPSNLSAITTQQVSS